MYRSQADRRLPPGAYTRDASELARLGRGAALIAGGAVVVSDCVELVADAVHDYAASADLLNLGEAGLLTGAAALTFHALHKRFGAKADELQNV